MASLITIGLECGQQWTDPAECVEPVQRSPVIEEEGDEQCATKAPSRRSNVMLVIHVKLTHGT